MISKRRLRVDMKSIYLGFAFIAVIAVAIYTFCNRDSDRVLLSFSTAIVIAVFGFIVNEAISNKTIKFSKEFPVAVFFELPNYQPLFIRLPYSWDLGMCMQSIKSADRLNSAQSQIDLEYAQNKYFEALQYIVIKDIFQQFNNGWDTETKRIIAPSGEMLSTKYGKESGKEINFAKFIQQSIPNNYFVKSNPLIPVLQLLSDTSIFPPDTDIKITLEGDHSFLIFLETKYISVAVKLSKLLLSPGIGEYARMFPAHTAHGHDAGTATYMMSVSVEQAVLLNGNPEMKKHRKWADTLVTMLDSTFNFERIREEHLKQYQLFGSQAIMGW